MIDFNTFGFESSASGGKEWTPRVSLEQGLSKTKTLQGDVWAKIRNRFTVVTTNRAWEEYELRQKISMENEAKRLQEEKIRHDQRKHLLKELCKSNGTVPLQNEEHVLTKKKRARRRELNLQYKAHGRE